MVTVYPYDKHKFKAFPDSDDEEIQLSWLKGLIEQVEFANKPEVLYFVLELVRRRCED